jgi:WD40 repeat protein
MRLWDLQGHQLDQPLLGHKARVLTATFSPDSQTIASGSADGPVRLWKLNGTLRHQLNADKSLVGALARSWNAEWTQVAVLAGVLPNCAVCYCLQPEGHLQQVKRTLL